jgi:hypothetical protein
MYQKFFNTWCSIITLIWTHDNSWALFILLG